MIEYDADFNYTTKTLGNLQTRTKRISGISDNGFGYELDVKKSCKFNPITNKCCGSCSGNNEDCTLKRIQSKETLNKLLKPLNYKLEDAELFEDNFEMHRMNSQQFLEKIRENEQNNEDLESFRIFDSEELRESETNKIFDRLTNGVKQIVVNNKIREQEHNQNVKNILANLELYGELL